MSEHNIDLSTKNLMCHNLGTIQCDTDPVKLFYRDDKIVTIVPSEEDRKRYSAKNPGETVLCDDNYKVDLKELRGVQCQDFYVSFHLLDENKIQEYQNDPEEKWFHALYHFINYDVSDWIGRD